MDKTERSREVHSITSVKGNLLHKEILKKGEPIFEDNFEFFDEDKWERQPNTVGHFTEFQWYTQSEENSYVKEGALHIRPTPCSYAKEKNTVGSTLSDGDVLPEQCFQHNGTFYPTNSSRVATQQSFAFKYGFVEIMAKIPSGDWLWPAIWFLPKDNVYGTWPRSGEIDLMESRGNTDLETNGTSVGNDQIASTLHWGPAGGYDDWRKTTAVNSNETFSTDFHKYQLSWTPDSISLLIDDIEIKSIVPPEGGFWELGDYENETDFDNLWINGTKMAPFDQEFYIILNIAVGGTTFFSDSYTNEGGKPWKNNSTQPNVDFWYGRDQWLPTWNMDTDDSHLIVDYVKVWAM